MFNGFRIEKENLRKLEAENRLKREAAMKNRDIIRRNSLNRKYSDRISQFMSKMIATPSPVSSYLPPIVAATHNSDPTKFKGMSSVICHRYMPEKERIQLTIDSYKFLSSPLNLPQSLHRSSSGPVKHRTPIKVSIQEPARREKTYFTGVTSLLFGPTKRSPESMFQHNQRDSVSRVANRVLVDSKVFRGYNEFLKKGQGKLACSPSHMSSEVHSTLNQSKF